MAHKTLIELTADEARKVLLKNESYVNFDLPNYFDFENLLQEISTRLDAGGWVDFVDFIIDESGQIKKNDKGDPLKKWPGYEFNVNHRIVVNKNSNLSWRPLELTHPVLYVALVHLLTIPENWQKIVDRFKNLSRDTIEVASIPPGRSLSHKTNKAEQITKWWEKSEQRSVELGLEFSYISETDIADCYSSIYTHSIAWAIHGRDEAFRNQRNKDFLGNKIDEMFMSMHHRQTNGIPQGSVLYDFVAELVLAYADTLIYDGIKYADITDYKIIRYRDDYKIFTKNKSDGDKILRIISDSLIDLGLRPNTSKTTSGKSLIEASFKQDKLDGLSIPKIDNNFAKQLMQIHQFSEKHPNSGHVSRMLNALHDEMYKKIVFKSGTLAQHEKPKVMISILVDMCTRNPRFYNIIGAIISLLLGQLDASEKMQVAETVHVRLQSLPNTSLLDLWLQRAVYKYTTAVEYAEPLTKLARDYDGHPINIWNNDWLNQEMTDLILNSKIINNKTYTDNPEITTRDEVDEFRDIPS